MTAVLVEIKERLQWAELLDLASAWLVMCCMTLSSRHCLSMMSLTSCCLLVSLTDCDWPHATARHSHCIHNTHTLWWLCVVLTQIFTCTTFQVAHQYSHQCCPPSDSQHLRFSFTADTDCLTNVHIIIIIITVQSCFQVKSPQWSTYKQKFILWLCSFILRLKSN